MGHVKQTKKGAEWREAGLPRHRFAVRRVTAGDILALSKAGFTDLFGMCEPGRNVVVHPESSWMGRAMEFVDSTSSYRVAKGGPSRTRTGRDPRCG